MPILSFKPELIAKVIDGTKPHTIRFPKRPWKVGDIAMHATGVRTSKYKEHRRDVVTRVDPIEIIPRYEQVVIPDAAFNEFKLHCNAIQSLAMNDGFDDVTDFFQFFLDAYPTKKRLIGQLIHWDENPTDYLLI